LSVSSQEPCLLESSARLTVSSKATSHLNYSFSSKFPASALHDLFHDSMFPSATANMCDLLASTWEICGLWKQEGQLNRDASSTCWTWLWYVVLTNCYFHLFNVFYRLLKRNRNLKRLTMGRNAKLSRS
jgi:hypothetical protein